MQKKWLLAIGGCVVFGTVLVIVGIVILTGGGNGSEATGTGCPPPESTASAGNANIAARAIGNGLSKELVIRVTDKKTGVPLHDASVQVQGTMTCPHYMPLIQRTLPEASTGTYKGAYPLIMQGDWTIHIVVRSKQGDATTSALPLKVKFSG